MKSSILLILLIILTLAGCNFPASQPTPTVTPVVTTPAPVQSSPTVAPATQVEELPHYDITLLSFSGAVVGSKDRHAYIAFSGKVRNDSLVSLDAVEVVITSYNEKDKVIARDTWHTDPWVIKSGETAQFGVQVTNYLAAVRYEVSFEQLNPSVLNLSTSSGVSTIFEVYR